MEFDLGKPEHGWVHVCLTTNIDTIEFEASDVPNDPVACLVDAIRHAAAGRDAEVWWHLEPDGYYFEFQSSEKGLRLSVLYAENSDRSKAEVKSVVEGDRLDILLPLWRALRKFCSYGLGEPHWPSQDAGSVAQLREAIGESHARG